MMIDLFQDYSGYPITQECCLSKTVGAYSYTQIYTSVPIPKECKILVPTQEMEKQDPSIALSQGVNVSPAQ